MAKKVLYGTNFTLRSWKAEDAEQLVRHANNKKIACNLRDGFPYPYTLSDAASWLEMILKNRDDLIFAIEINSEACGGIGLHGMKDVYRFNAEIGYWLSESFWGRGVISEAIGLIVDFGFSTYVWRRIYAGVFSTNIASMKVLEKNGFTREAVHRKAVRKEGEFKDEIIYALLKEEWESGKA